MKIVSKSIDFRKRDLFFVDLETTGLDLDKHEIIEVGCLRVDHKNFNIISEYEAKVKPEHIETASSEALKLNGYSEKEWEDAKPLKEVLIDLNKMAKDAMIIAWNVSFESSFLTKAFEKLKIKPLFDYHLLDVPSIAYSKLYFTKKPARLRLRKVAEYYGIKVSNKHRALEDAKATYEVFKKLMKM